MEPAAMEIDVLLDRLYKDYENIVVNGNGSILFKDKIKSVLNDKVRFSNVGQNMPLASSVCELALIKYKNGITDNYFTLVPEYLRESQAQRELNEREQ
jgi:tRNA threonylcarbamoyladenosine biosynthesis protein TsaB